MKAVPAIIFQSQ